MSRERIATETEPVAARTDQHYWSLVMRRFRKRSGSIWALRLLYVLLFVALFADFLANERPIYCKIDGETYFPIFRSYLVDLNLAKEHPRFLNQSWLDQSYDQVLPVLIPYSYHTQDKATYVSPLAAQEERSWHKRHWLGTDRIGRDVAAGLIYGTRIAMLVGIIAMGIAGLIGISLGGLAGYFGDERLRVSRARLWLNILGLIMGIFYAFSLRSGALRAGPLGWEIIKSLGILLLFLLAFNLLSRVLERRRPLAKKVNVPVDMIVMRLIEIKRSLPTLLLLLAVLAIISRPNIYYVMAIIGLLGWTGIARFMRAEILRIRNLEYLEAARALGYSHRRILLRHAIPNGLTPVLTTLAFGVAGAVLIEASLSFLGIGTPPDQVTWGQMLRSARSAPYAWWLAVFPGFAIFLTVTVFNVIGAGLSDAVQAR